jgi:hypothetical protein
MIHRGFPAKDDESHLALDLGPISAATVKMTTLWSGGSSSEEIIMFKEKYFFLDNKYKICYLDNK